MICHSRRMIFSTRFGTTSSSSVKYFGRKWEDLRIIFEHRSDYCTAEIQDIFNTHPRNLDTNKTSGPDGIPWRLIKEGSLSLLFNLSLFPGVVPAQSAQWKFANLILVFQKEDSTLDTNYWSLHSVFYPTSVFNHSYCHLSPQLYLDQY